MSDTVKSQEELAREALDVLEQAYGYYTPDPIVMTRDEDFVEYYEYAAAA